MTSEPTSEPHGRRFAVMIAALVWLAQPASAAENGSGVYPLGLRSPLSGIVPAPGLYFQNDVMYYNGTASASRPLPLHGNLVADVRAVEWIDLPTLLWSTPVEIAGGNLALSATLPVGGPDIKARLGLASADLNSAFVRNAHESNATVGDPFLSGAIGWHAGDLHWTTGLGVNVPVGDYTERNVANLAFHHWAADLYGSATWLDTKTGRELSGSLGITFNGENHATQYTSGTELHLDFAAIQHLPGGWSVGLVGYHYNQLTGDSGAGALLGDFKGRVTALGGTLGYTFKFADRDISTRVKVFREFDVQNRLEGTAAYLTIALPLSAYPGTSGARPAIAKN
jgi:hypothetical protein